jgi:hypothetical protein
MNADRPKIKFIVLSVVKVGDRGVVRGDVGFEVGSIGWGVVASAGVSVGYCGLHVKWEPFSSIPQLLLRIF